MSGDATTGRERQEMVVAVRVAGWGEGNGAEGAGSDGVGRGMILKKLDIGAKFETKRRVVGRRDAGHDGKRAQGRGDAVVGGEQVEAAHGVGHHVNDHEFGQALERKTVDGGPEALLDGANGALNFPNVAVGGNDIKVDW